VTTPYTPAYDIYLGEGDGSWQEASNYHIWTRKDAAGDTSLSVLERREGQVLRVPERSRVMHRIPGGTPYHIEHLFGFWRTTAADTIFIRAEMDDGVYYTLVVATTGKTTGKLGTETVAWYCPKCNAELTSDAFAAGRLGLRAFWDHALEQTRAFNANARACADCGNVHPYGYGFDGQLDDEHEREGRAAW
jgi:hypothetical protein